MSTRLVRLRRRLIDARSHSFVQYSSLTLLLAIAAIAIFAQLPLTR
ncbi:MAG: hypothetical protein JSR91_05275 [Proteobacteria bacterium]|nr:hypothetical protein [Pseudomonadota bacterium]